MTLLWLVTLASLGATIANIFKLRICFLVWLITNAVWALVDYEKEIPEQAALHLVYCGLAAYGLWRWTMEARADGRQAHTG